jgi:hypothetical protein
MRLWNAAKDDDRLERLKEYRDKFVAHIGKFDPDIPRPIYNDLFGFAHATCNV